MVTGIRFLAVSAALFLFVGLAGGQAASGKSPTKLKLAKEGNYSQTFKNRPGLWQDDTSVTVWVRKHRIVEFWVTSNYRFDGGKTCAPIGFTGTLMPDQMLSGPVSVQVRPKKPVALNAKNRFRVPVRKGHPFLENDGGSIQGRLLRNGKLSINVKFAQAANAIQGRCSTAIKAPKAKFRSMKLNGIID